VALLLAGLVLIGLSGCFLIGALTLVKPELVDPQLQPGPLSSEAYSLLVTLYAVAAMCLLGALLVFLLGVRGLLRVLRERPAEP
jgi:hypothetical protein